MNNLRRIVVLMAVVSLLVGGFASVFASGNRESDGSGGKIAIGMTTNDFNDKWSSYLHDAVEEWAAEHQDEVEFTLSNSLSDINRQMGHVEDYITQGYDVIVIKAVDNSAAIPMVMKAKDAGIPVVAVNLPIDGADSYVGADSVLDGENQMRRVVELLDGNGRVGIISGDPGSIGAIQRLEGNKNILAESPGIELVAEETGMWQRERGMAIMENWLQAGIEMDAVVCSNDEMAIGALLVLEAAGISDQYIVTGIDATPDAVELVKDGRLDFTIFQDAQAQGYGAMEVALRIARGEDYDAINILENLIVTIANVSEYE